MTDDDLAEYEEQLDSLEVKALLVEQTAALRGIYAQLDTLTHALADVPEESDEPMYECTMCGATVAAEDRRDHAEREHGAPSGINLDKLDQFEAV